MAAALAMPYPFAMPDDPYAPAPPAYHDGHIARVKIQAYRGPTEPKGGYDSFAPWGFYVTQPKDNFYGYGHH